MKLREAVKLDMQYPEDDSEDLTDAEIERAVITEGIPQLVEHLTTIQCASCQHRMDAVRYELRRRKPHLYWRVGVECDEGHSQAVLFQTDWL